MEFSNSTNHLNRPKIRIYHFKAMFAGGFEINADKICAKINANLVVFWAIG